MAMDPQQLELEQLKLLFDYTKFHIGIYATLITALVAAREYWPGPTPGFLKGTLAAFLVAGAAGGVVASNIPAFQSYSTFTTALIGVLWFQMKGDSWVHVEHAAFWLGILWAVGNVLIGPAKHERSAGFTPSATAPGSR
jgi:hypothetical protein